MRQLAVPLTLLAGACAQDPVVPRIEEQPIVLSIAISSSPATAGRPDTIRVTATNNFTGDAVLRFGTTCQIEVTIRNAQGTPVVPPNGRTFCTPVSVNTNNLAIPAGGSVTQRFIWDGGDSFLPTNSTVRLPAGTYFVSAAINALNYSTFAPAIRLELVNGS